MRAHGRADGVAEVAQEMPPVRNMDGIPSALPGAVGVDIGEIADDHLDGGVVAQPRREARRVAVGQQIHHRAAFQVHQDGELMVWMPPPLGIAE